MRNSFINRLTKLTEKNAKTFLIVGDLGYSVVEEFAEKFPQQYFNAGITEQAMTSVAAGLSTVDDRTVFTYSIANFPTLRCLEQIRNDICYHQANVKIVAVGGGVAYGTLGYTHFGSEDLAILSALPGITVASPADAHEAVALCDLAVENPGPWYIRLGRNGEPKVHANPLQNLKLGSMLKLREGGASTILSTGSVTYEAMQAVDRLADSGIDYNLYSCPFIKPIGSAKLSRLLKESKLVVTIEEHSATGGLGSIIADIMATEHITTPLHKVCLPDLLETPPGDQTYLRQQFGMDASGLFKRLKKLSAVD